MSRAVAKTDALARDATAPGAPRAWLARVLPSIRAQAPAPPVGADARVIARRYHLSLAGIAYVATTCVLVVGAINGQNNLLFWLFGLAVGGVLVSGVLSGWSLMGISVRRDVQEASSVGEPLVVRYTITNRNRLFGAFALVVEELPSALTWWGKPVRADFGDKLSRPAAYISYVPPRSSVVVEATPRALARGQVHLGPVRVSSTFPFGIMRKSVTLLQESRALIRPRAANLAIDPLPGAGGHGPAVGRATPSRQGSEFYALREFRSGDALRQMAWRATARMDKPMVRTFSERPGRRLWIVLDGATLGATTVEPAASVAATVLELALRRGLEPGLADASGRALEFARPGARQRDAALDTLALYAPGTDPATSADAAPRSEQPAISRQDLVLVLHAGPAPRSSLGAHAIRVDDPRTFDEQDPFAQLLAQGPSAHAAPAAQVASPAPIAPRSADQRSRRAGGAP
jgi:uncharacterized protein (DUF58 family)